MNYFEYIQLIDEINFHMDAYYNNNEAVISDYEYDLLMQRLKECERENPDWVTPDSPSQKIGGVAKRSAGEKVEHDVPMLSIEDVFSKENVVSWVDKVKQAHPDCSFSVETKIDGLSMSLRYAKKDDGLLHLELAETRGDGLIGEDVTLNALVIPDVRKTLNLPYDALEIRGEVYMGHGEFEKYNQIQESLGKKLAANPRNLAAGTLRQLDPSITEQRGLKMFVFNVQSGPDELMKSHIKSMDILESCGIPVVFHRKCSSADEILAVIDEIADMRESLPYDIDGAVVKIDEIALRNDFPAGAKYSSGHIAYKYPPEEKIIVMDDVLVDVGRTGKLTFTGLFHDKLTGGPAHLCGTAVSRATLHNQDYIDEMQVGIGGEYKLFKSGEIIPKLNGCVKPPKEVFKSPEVCPVCGNILSREEDTADIYCLSPECPAQLTRTISYFTSINCMNIMGLGETLVDALVKEGYLSSYADIYALQDYRSELILKGIIGKEKNTDKILANIEKSKNNSPIRLLTGLGIRNVGKQTAKELFKNFNSLDEIISAPVEKLVSINDIGLTTAEDIRQFFDNPLNLEIIGKFKEYGLNMVIADNEMKSSKLAGLTIVVTGTLNNYGRKEITDVIEANGGKCSGSVSKKTDYLIAGEAAGSKLDKARELGVKIISEEEFKEMIK